MDESITPTKPLSCSQTIRLTGADDKESHEIVGNDVTVFCGGGSHNHGSSKVKLKNIVDYNWENRLYTGQLLAVHMAGKYIAYGIKAMKKVNQTIQSGLVRIAHRDHDQRALLRGMKGQIQDIAFAYIPTQVILGCVDEEGTLFVHNIESDENNFIVCTLLLNVVHKPDPTVSMYHRILWCPYMPEEENGEIDDDGAKLLVLTQGCKAEMWNVNQVNQRFGVGPHRPGDFEDGYLEIVEHKLPIIDAAFSPDGTALATASMDGDVKFFQVYMHNESKPRCLHQWQPHGGSALSCLFFLDDHRTYIPEMQFWKFAITGCENNSVLKVWSCETWACLQTITLKPSANRNMAALCLKAGVDNSAGYLLLSDIQNRILYVLQIHRDISEKSAYIRTISEFSLQSPILSFGIFDAGIRKLKCTSSTEDLYLQDGVEIEDGNIVAVIIRMYIVQPKSLQECHIVYQPQSSSSNHSLSTVAHDSLLFQDELVDLSTGPEVDDPVSVPVKKASVVDSEIANQLNLIVKTDSLITSQSTSQPLNLMTPDLFKSPVRRESVDTAGVIATESTPLKTEPSENLPENDTDMIHFNNLSKDNFVSGGSSPSREVQEILSLSTPTYSNDFFDDNLKGSSKSESASKAADSRNLADFEENPNDLYANGINTSLLEGDGWPKIPIMKADEVRKSEENRANDEIECEPDLVNYKTQKNKMEYKKVLIQRIANLEDQLDRQNHVLNLLQQKISELQTDHSGREPHYNQLKTAVSSHIDNHLTEQNKILDNWIKSQAGKERDFHDQLIKAVSQIVESHVLDKLDRVVKEELRSSITTKLIASVENLKKQLHNEIATKLTSTDQLLKDNISKLVQNDRIMDILAVSMTNALRPQLEYGYKEFFNNTLLPSWERVCQAMFQQIHETFTQGTKEYTVSLEGYLERQRKSQEKATDIVAQLQTVSDSMRINSEHLATCLSKEIQKQMQNTFDGIQENIKKTVRQEVKEQIDRGFRNHAAVLEDSVINAVKSRAVTPSPHIIDTQVQQTQIQQLIVQGQINAAFQLALSASDLALVVYTCEKINPQQIFNQSPCPLQQNVLLSLIQQLSADMSNHTEIKYKYLEEAVMNLQATNPMTREHMPIVLKELQRQLTTYINCNPTSKMRRQMKMLLMATHSLIQ